MEKRFNGHSFNSHLYKENYGIEMEVVRNFPEYRNDLLQEEDNKKNRTALADFSINISASTSIIIYQGAINIDRGIEEAIAAMEFVNDAVLLIIGDGDIAE